MSGKLKEDSESDWNSGRLGGLKGGKARAASLSSGRRVEIARKAARVDGAKVGLDKFDRRVIILE